MKNIILLFLLTIVSSCLYNHTAAIEELGEGFYYLGDGHESQILFDPEQRTENKSGFIVTGAEITEYNFNDTYIIAKSINSGVEKYWIIDKKMPRDSIKPLNNQEYQNGLKEKGINMKLKERK